jgi:hypothetical protein
MAARYLIPKSIKVHDGSERRTSPRAPLETDALVYSNGEKHLCIAEDISAGGVAIRVGSFVFLERFVQIDLFLPDSSVWTSLSAEVVRAKKTAEGIILGLSFHAPDCWIISNIEDHVRGRMTPQCLTGS